MDISDYKRALSYWYSHNMLFIYVLNCSQQTAQVIASLQSHLQYIYV